MTATVSWVVCVAQENPLAVPVFAQTQVDLNRRMAGALNSLARSHGNASVGDVKAIAGSSLPSGWLYCDGTAISRNGFPQLFAELGVKFGAGNGSTTFNLPDMRATGPVAATTAPVTVADGSSVTVVGVTPVAGDTGSTDGNISTGGRPRDGDLVIRIQ